MRKHLEDSALEALCRSVLGNAFAAFWGADMEARFYPYIGLTHTIRRRGSAWEIRISDHCRKAPKPVLEAIVMLLACKVMRRSPLRSFLRTYALFRTDPRILEAVRKRRLRRGRKCIAGERGTCHSLGEIYRELNSGYFNNQIEIGKIGWGLRKSWSRLGHYDPVHHTVALSPVLDSPSVPRFVVRYVVFHELLHAAFDDASTGGLRRHHSSAFRRAETAYPDCARAQKFLRDYCGKRR